MKFFIIVGLIFLAIIVIVGSIRKRKLLINKTVVILAIVGIGAFYLLNTFEGNNENDENYIEQAEYQKGLPSYQKAPYVLPTPSRAYYVVTFQDGEDYLVLTNYFYYDKENWENSDKPLPFDKSLPEFKNLKVYRRTRE